MSDTDKKWMQISSIKFDLKQSDWIIAKIMEAETEEERAQLRQKYADTITQRRAWRARINELENELSAMNQE
jgi:hypothetical protein